MLTRAQGWAVPPYSPLLYEVPDIADELVAALPTWSLFDIAGQTQMSIFSLNSQTWLQGRDPV